MSREQDDLQGWERLRERRAEIGNLRDRQGVTETPEHILREEGPGGQAEKSHREGRAGKRLRIKETKTDQKDQREAKRKVDCREN